jgi:ligand-binding SRPBCC domain-containing protein
MHHLETKQIIAATLQKSWEFFSDPTNLRIITPPGMGFRIIRQSGDKMYPGMIISGKQRAGPGCTMQ